jgi:lipoprotein-anchoring transpeptidase ErfK/SrfK
MLRLIPAIFLSIALMAGPKTYEEAKTSFDPAEVNDPQLTTPVKPGLRGAAVLRAQVLLDRANFSPGEIDGACGRNLQVAVRAFQKHAGLSPSGIVDPQTWRELNRDTAPALIEYTLAPDDVAGPFARIPDDIMMQAKLESLSYASALEKIAEKFHASAELLKRMNPGKSFESAGTAILVPNVITAPPRPAASLVVDASEKSVTAVDGDGSVIAHYPATIGSKHDPLPVGKWKITRVHRNPAFHYNPALFWDADPSHAKAKIAPGPNNPVGVVWIDLSKEHYGIHGTPEPGKIGYTQSHGCIRLTNWDAMELAQLVQPETPAVLQE